jgi:hypothetical protein
VVTDYNNISWVVGFRGVGITVIRGGGSIRRWWGDLLRMFFAELDIS